MENHLSSNKPLIESHNEFLEIYRGEYSYGKDGVKIKKDNWKKYLIVLQDVKAVYSSFMIYKKSTNNWLSETPKYKYDLTSGKFQVKVLNSIQDRYLFEIYFQESDTRFLISTKDETVRNTWVHWLTGTKYIDPSTNTGPVYLVRVLETLETRKFHITGVCYLHILKDKFLLTKISDRSLLAEWPIEVVRFYSSGQDTLKLELGRKAMHGEMILYFQTNKALDLFHIIKSCVSRGQDVPLKTKETPVQQKESHSPEYATVNLKKKVNRRVQLGISSELAIRKIYTPPPTTPCDYESVSVNMKLEIQDQSQDLVPFETFEDYDTLEHLRSAFGGSHSSSSQSDTSDGDSRTGEYTSIGDFKPLPPSPPPPPQIPVTICVRERKVRKLVIEQPAYSTIGFSTRMPSSSTHNLPSPKQIVSNLWSCQSKPPVPSSTRNNQTQSRKKSSGIDECIMQALDTMTVPDNVFNTLIDIPTSQSEPCQKKATRGIYRRNGTKHRNRTIKPACATKVYTCKAY